MRLVLFDVDGTLVLTGGAGVRALTRTFEEMFGVPRGFDGLALAGRTDIGILADALGRAGLSAADEVQARFFTRYTQLLSEEVLQPGPRKGVLPGVRPLLEALCSQPDVCCALLTGNFAQAARIKLEHFGLWTYFACGAFGDDDPDRDRLVPVAVSRARERGAHVASMRDVTVVGDTPLDVRCAVAAGARCLAVATGEFAVERLRASGADAVLPDLSDTEHVLGLLNGAAR